MTKCREAFIKWAGKHQYLPIIERDFYACFEYAWIACLDAVDAELEPRASGALRDVIVEELTP